MELIIHAVIERARVKEDRFCLSDCHGTDFAVVVVVVVVVVAIVCDCHATDFVWHPQTRNRKLRLRVYAILSLISPLKYDNHLHCGDGERGSF